jgi:hypothetical protein
MIEFRRVPNKLERHRMADLDAIFLCARHLRGRKPPILPL